MMADPWEIAKAILAGEWELFDDAESKLTAAFEARDEGEKAFWRSVFEELCGPLKTHASLDDVSFHTYETARRYADGAVPNTGPDAEKDTPCL
jgi:hypothetical protein